MANSKVKKVDAAGEADTEKDAIALEAEAMVVAVVAEEMEKEADEATRTTMEAETVEKFQW